MRGEQQRRGDDGREFADGTVHQNGLPMVVPMTLASKEDR